MARNLKGILITFEGIDFSGKSVQANLLEEKLEKQGVNVSLFREPGGTVISEKIRDILLDRSNHSMCYESEVLLYSAARAQIVREKIKPYLERGHVVICDRYYDSTTVYQGHGREIDLDFIKKLNTFSVRGIVPGITFLIDLEPQEALSRHRKATKVPDRLDVEKTEFHKTVRNAYLELAQKEAQRFIIIDGNLPVGKIEQQVFKHVKDKLKL